MSELDDLVPCAAPDCDRFFSPNGKRNRQLYCSNICQIRVNKRRRRQVDPFANVDLEALRENCVHELVHAALAGGDSATMARVASVVVAVDKRLQRAG